MSIVNQVRTGVIWGISTKILNQILSWIVTIWVIRLLTPEDFAIIALSDLSIGFLLVVGSFGFHGAMVKAKELSEAQINQTFTFLILINIFLFGIFQIFSYNIAVYFNKEELEALIRVSSLLFIISPFTTISYALICRKMLHKKVAQVGFFVNILKIMSNLSLALLGYGFWALAIGVLFAQLTCAISYTYFSGFRPKLDFKFVEMKKLRSDSNLSFFTGITWELMHRVDIFLINSFVGSTALGIYRIGLSLAEKPVALVGQLIQQIGLSSFSKISADKELVGKYVVKASSLIAFVSFPVFFGIAAISPSLIPLVLGEKWITVIVPMQILCMAQLVNILKEVSGTALFAVGEAKRKLIQAVVVLVAVSVAWLAGLQISFIGGCALYTIIYIIWYVWHVIDTGRFIDLSGFWKYLIIPLFMSISMFLVVFLIGQINTDSSFAFIIALQVLCGFITYAAIGLLFFRAHCLSVLNLLRKKDDH